MTKYAHKIGAVFYILWGILHLVGGVSMLQTLSEKGAAGYLALLGTAMPANELPQITDAGVANGVFGFHAYNLIWMGIFALIIGAGLNWKNSRVGYWVNLGVVGAADIGLFLFLLLPGYMAIAPDALMGIILFAIAFIFSTIGVLKNTE